MTFVAAVIGAGLGAAVGGAGLVTGLTALGGAGIGALVGGSIGGSVNQANAARGAATAQQNAATEATGLQRDVFNTINQQQGPYRAAGYGALNQLQSMLPGEYQQYDAQGNPTTMATGTGQFTRMFTNEDLNANLAPNYQFMLNQGLGAARQGANVGGGGSNVLKSGITFAENYAKGAYQDALNNWRAQQGDIYNRLSGIAGIGQTGQGQVNTAGTNFANAAGQLGIGSATAYGAGQVGAANAYGNAVSNLGQWGAAIYGMQNRAPSTTTGTTSDRRLKKNIKVAGISSNGLNLYTFHYIWESIKDSLHLGYMADEVEKQFPEAVSEDKNGFKMVDYTAIPAFPVSNM